MKNRLALAVVFAAVTAGGTPLFAQVRSTDPLPVRPDQAEIDRARLEISNAQRRLQLAQQAVRSKFESQDDFIQAKQEITDAQRDFDAAREPVLAKLRDTDEYKRASQEARLASDKVIRTREGSPSTQPSSDQPIDQSILDAAQQKLGEQSEVSRMEANAIQQDSAARDAKAKLERASQKMAAIRTRYQAALLNDENWVAARKDLDRLTADARLSGRTTNNGTSGSNVDPTTPRPNSASGGYPNGNAGGDLYVVPGGFNSGGSTGTQGTVPPPATTQPSSTPRSQQPSGSNNPGGGSRNLNPSPTPPNLNPSPTPPNLNPPTTQPK